MKEERPSGINRLETEENGFLAVEEEVKSN